MECENHSATQSGASTPTAEYFTVGQHYPIIPGKLSLVVHRDQEHSREEIERHRKLFFFSSDFQEAYVPFCLDFGPVNLGVVHEFCNFMSEKWNDPRLANRQLVYYTEPDVDLRTNTAFLLACFLVTRLGYSPEGAWAPFASIPPINGMSGAFVDYRDATYSRTGYGLTIRSCLDGLAKGMSMGWYDPLTFDVDAYLFWEDPSVGDMHIICPKFCALRGPSRTCQELAPGCFNFPPQHYVRCFQAMGITRVIRLNDPDTYDARDFTSVGIAHNDIFFHDCTTPSPKLVAKFLRIAEEDKGGVAVHCHAGLGRTGCMISAYLMKHYGFTAAECIAWLRIVRPGSVLGKQQEFLLWLECAMRTEGWEQLQFLDPESQDLEVCTGMGNEVALAQARRAQRVHPASKMSFVDELPVLSTLLSLSRQPVSKKSIHSDEESSSKCKDSNSVLNSFGGMLKAVHKNVRRLSRSGRSPNEELAADKDRRREEYARGHNVPVSVSS